MTLLSSTPAPWRSPAAAEPAAPAPLRIRDVRLSWPDGQDDDGRPRTVHALDGVSLEARAGILTAVSGPSGSGKSSLLSVIAGLVSPSAGEVLVDGRDVAAMSPEQRTRMRRDSIGLVFQQPNLLASLTAREQLLLTAHIAGLGRRARREAAERADELLELLGLEAAAGRRAHQLSGGQQQRVNIGRALMTSPAVMLVDEPTAALDHERSAAVMQLLRETTRRFGIATVLVTHETELLEAGDRRLRMLDGRLSED
ncbi:ABC transporter ATP-binding protein [Kocuria palustris]|uniref:ABC transporter ATP-binding protein n=1 Tax=Kocuria palustris TaxID=71999 RepID=UPI0011A58A12|nr:ATP-binding cassette domain-containing protein [Kocuria palustris]